MGLTFIFFDTFQLELNFMQMSSDRLLQQPMKFHLVTCRLMLWQIKNAHLQPSRRITDQKNSIDLIDVGTLPLEKFLILEERSQGMQANGAFRAHCLQAKRKAEEFKVCSVCVRRFAICCQIINLFYFLWNIRRSINCIFRFYSGTHFLFSIIQFRLRNNQFNYYLMCV